jgi:hypothetical protein
MKTQYMLITLSLLVSSALAQTDNTFESPGRVDAKLFLPADVMSGPSHKVGPQAENDRLDNTYFLYSGDDAWGVTTGLALRERVKEIYAIQKLSEMKKGPEFAKAMANAAKAKVEGVVGIVTNPIGTVKSIPLGASRFFGRIGESLKGGKTQGEGSAIQNIAGVQKARVQLAVKLGVSPYSYNQELQKQLTDNARAMALGGLVVSGATAVVGGPAGEVITLLNVNQTLQQTLVNSTPDDLRIINRKKLFDLGVSRENADQILMHPWYSPWTETIMVDALASVGVDPTQFLAQAATALTAQDAVFFQRLAQIMSAYSANKSPLRSIHVDNGIVCAQDRNGRVLVPLSCDYAIWSEFNAGRLSAFAKLMEGDSDVKGLTLWVDGKVSDRARQEVKARQIELATDVLTKQGSSQE